MKNCEIVRKLNLKKEPKGRAFLVYFWGLPLIQFIILLTPLFSEVIVFLLLLSASFIWILENKNVYINSYTSIFLLIIIYSLYFLFNFIFNKNQFLINYVVNFIMYALLSVILTFSIVDYKEFLRENLYCSVVVFLIYSVLVIIGLDRLGLGNYMDFGFLVALPAYISMFIGRKLFQYKWILPIEIFCFIEIIFFANRSCLLSILLLWIFIYIFDVKKEKWHFIFITILLLFFLIILIFFDKIIIFFDKIIFSELDINSRIWKKFVEFAVTKDWDALFSGRLDIWSNAIKMFLENPFLGNGIASFESAYGEGYYTHNIILELLTEIGIFGTLIAIIWFCVYSYKAFYKQSRVKKIILIMFFCLAFPKLFLSNHYMKDIAFWGYIGLILKINQDIKRNKIYIYARLR